MVEAGILTIWFLNDCISLWPYGQEGLVITILLLGLMASVAVNSRVVELLVAM